MTKVTITLLICWVQCYGSHLELVWLHILKVTLTFVHWFMTYFANVTDKMSTHTKMGKNPETSTPDLNLCKRKNNELYLAGQLSSQCAMPPFRLWWGSLFQVDSLPLHPLPPASSASCQPVTLLKSHLKVCLQQCAHSMTSLFVKIDYLK